MSGASDCTCKWCKSYGNPDDTSNERPIICNDPWGVEIAGRCTRCHRRLGSAAYMVFDGTESVNGIPLGWKACPVCEACVTYEELEARHREADCQGCGRHLYFPRARVRSRTSLNGDQRQLITTCSNACYRKALRQRRRIKSRRCANCNTSFKSARTDARFCSAACKQSAYRLRCSAERARRGRSMTAITSPQDSAAVLAAGAYQLDSAAVLLSVVSSSGIVLDGDTLGKLDTAIDLIRQVEANFRRRYQLCGGDPTQLEPGSCYPPGGDPA